MATNRDVKRLLKKGLAGKEAARLIIEHYWERDHGRDGFLSDSEFNRVKAAVRRPQDVDDYNKYIGAYRLVDYSLREAHILALEAQLLLSESVGFLKSYYLDGYIRWRKQLTPVIMTASQFQEESRAIKDRQRERKLQELESLGTVLFERVQELAPDRWWDEWNDELLRCEEADPDDFGPSEDEYLEERYPELWPQAAKDILELIQAGKLQPVQLLLEDIDRLREIDRKKRAYEEKSGIRQAWDEWEERIETQEVNPPPHYTEENRRRLQALSEERDNLQREAYERAKKQAGRTEQARLVASLEQYRDGSLAGKEASRLQDYTFCLGEELYQAGLPEWEHRIDTYWEGYYEPELDEKKVAIVQEAHPWDLDEEGYFKEDYLDWLEDLTQVKALDQRFREDGRAGLLEHVQQTTAAARYKTKAFLAYQAVITTVSEMLGVDFSEDLKKWYREVEASAREYNFFAKHSQGKEKFWHFPEGLRVPTLKMTAYKPTPGEVQYLRERMAISLGPDWWEDVWAIASGTGAEEPTEEEVEEPAEEEADG